MLMFVLLLDLIIFLASASKLLVWVEPSSCFKSTQRGEKHKFVFFNFLIFFFFSKCLLRQKGFSKLK